MLTKEENELVTRTGPGTPMGEVMRRYWMPAILSSEVPEPDGAPVRVKLLGEKLVAYRDTVGKVGMVDEFCAHRRASLFLGRNEEGGLRCIYHGWKYDTEGNCLETPTEPVGSSFKDKIHLKAYPTMEMGGMIWAYLGPGEKIPPSQSNRLRRANAETAAPARRVLSFHVAAGSQRRCMPGVTSSSATGAKASQLRQPGHCQKCEALAKPQSTQR